MKVFVFQLQSCYIITSSNYFWDNLCFLKNFYEHEWEYFLMVINIRIWNYFRRIMRKRCRSRKHKRILCCWEIYILKHSVYPENNFYFEISRIEIIGRQGMCTKSYFFGNLTSANSIAFEIFSTRSWIQVWTYMWKTGFSNGNIIYSNEDLVDLST